MQNILLNDYDDHIATFRELLEKHRLWYKEEAKCWINFREHVVYRHKVVPEKIIKHEDNYLFIINNTIYMLLKDDREVYHEAVEFIKNKKRGCYWIIVFLKDRRKKINKFFMYDGRLRLCKYMYYILTAYSKREGIKGIY